MRSFSLKIIFEPVFYSFTKYLHQFIFCSAYRSGVLKERGNSSFSVKQLIRDGFSHKQDIKGSGRNSLVKTQILFELAHQAEITLRNMDQHWHGHITKFGI